MKFSKLVLATVSALMLSVSAGSATASVTPEWRHDLTATLNDTTGLIGMVPGGQAQSVKLDGVNNIQYFDFGVRADELVTKAHVNLDFTASPSLIANYSQLNVYLNDQLQQSLPLTALGVGKPVQTQVTLNPKLIKAANRLSIEFVGHYQTICENPTNEVLWVAINPSSALSLTKQKLRLGNDLARFPAPFINPSMNELTTLPFVFAKSPSDSIKNAAAVMASLGGEIAEWRGIDYPVYFNEAPADQHFVVFATNENRPEFLKDLPSVDGPEVILADAPNSRFAKMLVVTGRNDADLLIAARAFVASGKVLIGERFKAKSFKEPAPRQPYDAPNWLPSDRAVAFAQLMQYPKQLTARGQAIQPVHLPVRLAPDLYMAGSGTMSMNLKYRYTKPLVGEQAQLQVRVNETLVDSVNLSNKEGRGESVIELPAFDGPLASVDQYGASLGIVNDLNFHLQYLTQHSEGAMDNCKSVTLVSHQLEIEPTSTLNLSGLYHYAKLPDLGLFTKGAFPFSKMADLSETAVLMPLHATTTEMTTMLNGVARIAATTGLAASQVMVTSDVNARTLVHKDILLVGEMPLGLLEFEVGNAHELQQKVHDHINQNKLNDKSLRTLLEEQLSVSENAGIASVVSLQSPFNKERTVVALVSEGAAGARLLNAHLQRPSTLMNAKGSVCILTESESPCFEVGHRYYVGSLPWYQKIWTTVSQNPLILVLCAVLCASLIGYGIFRFMRRWIRGRA